MTKPSLERLEKETLGFPNRAKRIIVYDNKTLSTANDFLLSIKQLRKEIADTFNPIIEKAHKAHKEAVNQKKRYEEPLKEAEKTIKLQIASYMDEQRRIQREAEEKARREEEERQKKETEILERAKKYEDAGMKEEAEQIKNDIPLPKPMEIPSTPELEGISISRIWKWRVVDKNLIPREYLIVDSAKITSLVKATKGQIKIPGIEIYPEDSVAARTS